MAPLQLTLTVQMDAACDDVALQQYHPRRSLIGPALGLLSLQQARLRLDALALEEVFESGDALLQRVIRSYALQLLTSLYKLIGSLDLLRIPAAVVADFSGGVRAFFHEAPKGNVRGVAAGTAGLAGGIFGGLTVGGLSLSAAAARSLATMTGRLAFDRDYDHQRQLEYQRHPSTTKKGVAQGLRAVRAGFVGGVRGVVAKPIAGAREDGTRGFFKGMGKGLVGSLAMPIAGARRMPASSPRCPRDSPAPRCRSSCAREPWATR